jgi:hypothetical protein
MNWKFMVLILIILCAVTVFGGPQLISQFGEQPLEYQEQQPVSTQQSGQVQLLPVEAAGPTRTPRPTRMPSGATPGQTWLVMLYQDADDKILEQDIYLDLNEAEKIGSNDRVQIVAQVDRYSAGFQGDGNWTSAKRFYIVQDNDLNSVRSSEVANLGEVNMSDPNTLVDFVTWGVETYPSDKYVLILSDHGLGWPGGWSDPAPGGGGYSNIPLASRLGNELYLMDIDAALQEIRNRTGVDKFELIGMDACLMGQLEVLTALAPYARYAVLSQEIEPALGWAYTGFLGELQNNPDMDGAELSRHIVDNYILNDQRIVDDQARLEFLRQGSPMGGLFNAMSITPGQLAQQLEQGITISAVDLSVMPELLTSFNDFCYNLQQEHQQLVARARAYSQSFTNIFGSSVPPSYIDLGNFLRLLRSESSSSAVAQSIDRLLASMDRAIVAEKHGPKKPGATGIAIYFPNSQLYGSPVAGPESYTAIARRFANETSWDDFLEYHYTGNPFEPEAGRAAIPEPGARYTAPGSGEIQISSIRLSSQTASPGNPVLLSADISGKNIGYVYLFVGFYDADSNSIFVADSDYLESASSQEVEGVYYPVWLEDGDFTLEFEWEPVVFAISDGSKSVPALFTPRSYGATFQEATYTVDGVYTYADGGETRYARLLFTDGVLRQVFGFTQEDGTGAPREIVPQAGDSFTVLEKWMDLDSSGKVSETTQKAGDTLTFGDRMFEWVEMDAAAGSYVLGFIVEDLDGNAQEAFTQVTVE